MRTDRHVGTLLPLQHGLSRQPGALQRRVALDGLKFWIAGDLGADFSKSGEWAEITFEPSATKQQRDAITTIVPNVYPVNWKAFSIGQDAAIDWTATKGSRRSAARRRQGGAS